jgi:hypothetical protein
MGPLCRVGSSRLLHRRRNAARGRDSEDYGHASGYHPTSAVTFHACAAADTAFIGGFHVVGRRCVPFDVSVDHMPSIRIAISFFNGLCNQA